MIDVDASHDALPGLGSWLEAARRGDREALGRALVSFRDYLLLVANADLDRGLLAKGGASDVVQDAMLLAHRGFADFRGRSEGEWRNWLRAILARSLAQHRRRYQATAKRQHGREVPIESETRQDPASRDPTPSGEIARLEREAALLAAIERLPEHYREVVIWHHRERLPFEEIGRRQGISAEAARKVWTRSLGRLRQELNSEHGPS
jgi:RNA polymerase sigma-70 factor, ECF subfamily